jgi:hypothetical protein
LIQESGAATKYGNKRKMREFSKIILGLSGDNRWGMISRAAVIKSLGIRRL